MNQQKTAILIFANSAQQEAKNKPFKKSAAVFEQLNFKTLQKVKNSGLAYFHISEEDQIGNSFGERYTNAIQFVYDEGFENVITIGNDTPHLQTSQLKKTAKTLAENPIVLGPSKDGGYYMMGLNKALFNKELFLKLPWQTSNLTRSIKCLLLKQKAEVVFLKRLQDIDSLSDLSAILNSSYSLNFSLRKLLLFILFFEIVLFQKLKIFQPSHFQGILFNKGSPLFSI